MALVALVIIGNQLSCTSGQAVTRRPLGNRNRFGPEKAPILKDAFFEDNSFVVRIKTTYNQTTSITCNAVLMDEQLVLSDVTCIKYQGMANIDSKFVQVIAGEVMNETVYEVEAIYINKADPRDPSTELALLRLSRPIKTETQCRNLIRPELNHSIEFETAVRVIGYTSNYELKENRTRVAKKTLGSKYICTLPADLNETPGSQLLKGAPLLHMVDCKQFQLVGILTKLDFFTEPVPNPRKHQDCYVMVSTQMRWYEKVKILNTLAAKNDRATPNDSGVIVVTVDDEEGVESSENGSTKVV